jgi:hypothetical protein
MSDRWVWVRVLVSVEEIFKHKKQAIESGASITWMLYSEAVGIIRHRCFVRSRGECEMCGCDVLENQGHLHEKLWRGKGGNISYENSIFICPHCHRYEHRSREIKFTRRPL